MLELLCGRHRGQTHKCDMLASEEYDLKARLREVYPDTQ